MTGEQVSHINLFSQAIRFAGQQIRSGLMEYQVSLDNQVLYLDIIFYLFRSQCQSSQSVHDKIDL